MIGRVQHAPQIERCAALDPVRAQTASGHAAMRRRDGCSARQCLSGGGDRDYCRGNRGFKGDAGGGWLMAGMASHLRNNNDVVCGACQ
jgi:hypothetical protein